MQNNEEFQSEAMEILADDEMKHREAPSEEELNAMHHEDKYGGRLATALAYADAHPEEIEWQRKRQLMDLIGEHATRPVRHRHYPRRANYPGEELTSIERENVEVSQRNNNHYYENE